MAPVKQCQKSPCCEILPSAASPPTPSMPSPPPPPGQLHSPLPAPDQEGIGAPKKKLRTPEPFQSKIEAGHIILGRLNWRQGLGNPDILTCRSCQKRAMNNAVFQEILGIQFKKYFSTMIKNPEILNNYKQYTYKSNITPFKRRGVMWVLGRGLTASLIKVANLAPHLLA